MAAYGYQLEPIRLSLGQSLQFYALDWPSNLARMVAKNALETLKDRRGRTPPPHTLLVPIEQAVRDHATPS